MASTPYSLKPSSAGTIEVIYGINDELTNYILQDVTVTEDVVTVQIPDQKGAIAQIKSMQHHWTISFTAIGPNTAPLSLGAQTFPSSNGLYYHVNSVERRATYNDTQKWSVTMEAWEKAVAYPTVDSTTGQELHVAGT